MNKPPAPEGWPNFGIFYGKTWRGRLKSATLLATVGIAYYMVFHVRYNQEEHVFDRPRRWHAKVVRDLFG